MVIPAYNEAARIEPTLRAVVACLRGWGTFHLVVDPPHVAAWAAADRP